MKGFTKPTMAVMFAWITSVAMPTNVLAVDSKVYPGAMCQPVLGAEAAFVNTLNSGIFNESSGSLEVTCPIVRNNVENTNGTRAVFVTVRRSGPTTSPVVCSLFSFSPDGLSVVDSDFASANVDVVKVIRLNVADSVPNGHYTLQCVLPEQFGVVQYKVEEFFRQRKGKDR